MEVIERAFRIASFGTTEEMNAFLDEGHDINAFYGMHTLLHNAIKQRADIKKINLLIQKGADVNQLSEEGFTPLTYAMLAQDSIFADLAAEAFKKKTEIDETKYLPKVEKTILPMMELLIRNGADINGSSAIGTPLHLAASGKSLVILYYLLDKGAEPNVRDASGATPLFSAARALNRKGVDMLLKFGANPKLRDKDGKLYSDYYKQRMFRGTN